MLLDLEVVLPLPFHMAFLRWYTDHFVALYLLRDS